MFRSTTPESDSGDLPTLDEYSPIHTASIVRPRASTDHTELVSDKDQLLRKIEQLERGLSAANNRIGDLEAEVVTLKREVHARNNRLTPTRPPNLNSIDILNDDIVRLNDGDTDIPMYHLTDDQLREVKNDSLTRRRFVAQISRMMYSIDERAKNVNVAGKQNREMLSPTKIRFKQIGTYTSQMYGCPCDEVLYRDIRVIIDETNRKFRDDLRMRKYRLQLRAENN